MKKILFIEDEPDMVAIMEPRLRNAGFKMLSAPNGIQGLRAAVDEKPDLILLDILMPHMDGYEACERLKKDPQTKDIPVIVVTAVESKSLEDNCKFVGADDFIRKPYDPEELIAKIKKILKDE